MSNSSAIDCVAAACRSGDKINTLKLAADCGMSRRWVQERVKAIREAVVGLVSGPATPPVAHQLEEPDPLAPASREPGMVRFLDAGYYEGDVTKYGPLSADSAYYHGTANSLTGDHHHDA